MPPREVGELIGEMSMFSGGRRNSDVVAMSSGYIAVFPFAHLQHLKQTHAELAEKVVTQLARAALAKRLETEGRDIRSASEPAVSAALEELRARQASMPWVVAAAVEGAEQVQVEESLLRRASASMSTRGSRVGSTAARDSSVRGSVGGSVHGGSIDEAEVGTDEAGSCGDREGRHSLGTDSRLSLPRLSTERADEQRRKESTASQQARPRGGEAEAEAGAEQVGRAGRAELEEEIEQEGKLMSEVSLSEIARDARCA